MAYVLLVERIERAAMLSQIVAALAATAGQQVDFTDPVTVRDRFDAWLAGPLERGGRTPRARHLRELEAALGVGADM